MKRTDKLAGARICDNVRHAPDPLEAQPNGPVTAVNLIVGKLFGVHALDRRFHVHRRNLGWGYAPYFLSSHKFS
jgi:hypothetical protein